MFMIPLTITWQGWCVPKLDSVMDLGHLRFITETFHI